MSLPDGPVSQVSCARKAAVVQLVRVAAAYQYEWPEVLSNR